MDATHIAGAAFFLLCAVLAIARRDGLLDYGKLYPRSGVPRIHRARIEAAFAARGEIDAFRTGWAGFVTGVLCLGFAPLVLLTDIPFDTVLGALVLVLALVLAACYVLQPRVRQASPNAAARAAVRGVPWYVWTVVALLAVAPLLWFAVAPIGATLFTCANLCAAALAYRFATRPAQPLCDDPSVEIFVDGRIRTTRVAVLCALAIVPAYVFEISTASDLTLPMHAVLFVAPLGIVFSNVYISRAARLVRAA